MLACDKPSLSEDDRLAKEQKVYACLEEYVKIAKKIYGEKLLKVILYGSYARGDFKEDSDVDILLLIDVSPKNERQNIRDLIHKTFDIVLDNELDIQPLIKSIYTFEKWKKILPFYQNIEEEGEVLYARAS